MEDPYLKQQLIDQIVETQKALDQSMRVFYSQHFYEFNRDVLGWPDIYEPLHRRVCDFVVTNPGKKKLILLPRGTFKSSIVTVGYPLYRIAKDIVEQGDVKLKCLLGNAIVPMSTKFLSQIKSHLDRNEGFTSLYGNRAENSLIWRDDAIDIRQSQSFREKEYNIEAWGLEGSRTGSHYNLMVLDDLVSEQNIGTKEAINKTIDSFKDIIPLLDPGGELLLIGTTWHESDLYGYIQDIENNMSDDFVVMVEKAYTGEWGKGELLFPTVLTWDELQSKKNAMGPSKFSAQYLLEPVPADTAIFKQKFHYYEESDIRGLKVNTFILVDPAFSESQEADYSAMIAVSITADWHIYIRDIFMEKVKPSALFNEMFLWDKKWKPVCFGLETTAFQRTLQHFAEAEMRKRNHFIPIKHLTHSGARGENVHKYQRIVRLEPYYAQGMVYHNRGLKRNEDLEWQLRHFPKNKNDDVIDALSSITEVAYPPRKFETREGRSIGQARRHYPA